MSVKLIKYARTIVYYIIYCSLITRKDNNKVAGMKQKKLSYVITSVRHFVVKSELVFFEKLF